MPLPCQSQRRESNPQPPHYECGALPIEATLAAEIYVVNSFPRHNLRPKRSLEV